ncbi:MAG: DUF1688 family protein [Kofleriaceae bacterium]
MSGYDLGSGFIAPGAAADATTAVTYLRSPLAVRVRATNVLEAGLLGELRHFKVDRDRVSAVADRVIAVTRANYPNLRIPVHGRLGHFRVGGVDRVAELASAATAAGAVAAESLIDLVVVSVLLDAGAGDGWRYREPATGLELARSEGLAVASLRAFQAGLFSADALSPLRVDAAALRSIDDAQLEAAFQASPANPLVGVAGRAELLRRLGDAIDAQPGLFPGGRPSGLLTSVRARAGGGVLGTGGATGIGGGGGVGAGGAAHGGIGGGNSPYSGGGGHGHGGYEVRAADLLGDLLEGLGPIWPGRIELGGVNLGDCWRHPAAGGTGVSAGLVPFHKLSQWLTYSLFEPFELGGVTVVQPGAMTGLAEYRNGGLLVDMGVLVPRHAGVLADLHDIGSDLVVEWRALTVALLDWVADSVREKLRVTPDQLPLARILEGGTWHAGRLLARERRPTGGPPIRVDSDGTVM